MCAVTESGEGDLALGSGCARRIGTTRKTRQQRMPANLFKATPLARPFLPLLNPFGDLLSVGREQEFSHANRLAEETVIVAPGHAGNPLAAHIVLAGGKPLLR